MTYHHKWTIGMQLLQRKARAALREYLMIPFVHFDPNHLATPMDSTSTVCRLFSLKAKLKLRVEHFHITSAFLHNASVYAQTVYVKETPRANGTYHHGKTTDILSGKMYCGRSVGTQRTHGLAQR